MTSSSHTRNTRLNIASGGLLRLVCMISSLLATTLILRTYPLTLFGFYAFYAAYGTFLTVFDLGIGSKLQSSVASWTADPKIIDIKSHAATALQGNIIIALLVALFSALLYSISSPLMVPIEVSSSPELSILALVNIIGYGLLFATSSSSRILLGAQKGWLLSTFQTLASFSLLGSIIACNQLEAPFWAFTISSLLISIIFSTIQLHLSLKAIHFDYRYLKRFKLDEFLLLFRQSSQYITLNIGGILLYVTPGLIVTWVAGLEAAAIYSVVARYTMSPLQLVGTFFQPLWPAYTFALARNDGLWIKRAFSFSILATLAYSAILLTTALIYPILAQILYPQMLEKFTPWLILSFCLWNAAIALSMPSSTLLNAFDFIIPQMYFGLFPAVAANALLPFALSILGVAGAAITFIVVFSTVNISFSYYFCSRIYKKRFPK